MSRVKGVNRARANNAARVDALEGGTVEAIKETVDDVHRTGRSHIDSMTVKRSGELRRNYRRTFRPSEKRGLVGYISKQARRAAFYARFVHDGTSKSRSRPFHALAVAEHDGRHKKRMRAVQRQAISSKAAPSGLARTGRGKVKGV